MIKRWGECFYNRPISDFIDYITENLKAGIYGETIGGNPSDRTRGRRQDEISESENAKKVHILNMRGAIRPLSSYELIMRNPHVAQ